MEPEAAPPALRSFVEVSAADGLSGILDPSHNVAIWRRAPLDEALAGDLTAYAASRPPPRSFEGSPGRFDPLEFVSVIPSLRAAQWLAADLAHLVDRFRTLSGRDHVHVQLLSVPDGACRKFHVDFIGLRMLVTYAGPGTEWLRDQDVDRRQLSRADLDAESNNALIVRSGRHPQRAATHDVVVLKGEHFRGNAGRGAVHRSPPMDSLARPRLLLKLDVAQCGC